MNLYLRLLWTLLKSAFLPRITPGDLIERTFRVWPNDLDINGHMNIGRYMTVADLMIIEYFIRCGLFKVLLRQGWRPMLGGAMIRFRRGLKPFQKYTLRFRLQCWDEQWNYMAFEFIRDGQVAASGLSKGAVVGADGFVSNAIAYAQAGYAAPSPPLPESVLRWREADSLLVTATLS
jgi:acyl-CoA thioesterase FadM